MCSVLIVLHRDMEKIGQLNENQKRYFLTMHPVDNVILYRTV